MTDSTIPARPSLEYDRKQARKLHKKIQQQEVESIARLCASHPRYTNPVTVDPSRVLLADVQLTIAREYGFASWPRWKAYVEISGLRTDEKIDKFLRSVCSTDVGYAMQLLRVDDSFTEHDVCAAAAAGNVSSTRRLLTRNGVNDVRGPYNTTPLAYACLSRLLVTDPARREGIVECVRLLLEAGAEPNCGYQPEGNDDPNARQTAIYGVAGIANNAYLTRLLLEAGAIPDDGETVYHTAEFTDTTCLELVLSHSPGKQNLDYCLGRALDFERPDAALLFVRYGADVDHRVAWFSNQTHLMKAIQEHCDSGLIARMIERSSDLEARDKNRLTAYRVAIRFGNIEARSLLEARGVRTDKVSNLDRFCYGCMVGDAEEADRLVSKTRGLIRQMDHRVMVAAVRTGNHEALRLFIKSGVPIDKNEGMPVLHQACYWGHLETARLLLDLGASLSVTNEFGGTALGATLYGSVSCHDRRGGPKALPPESVAPGDYARIAELLIERGSKLPEEIGGSPAVIEVLQRHGVQSG